MIQQLNSLPDEMVNPFIKETISILKNEGIKEAVNFLIQYSLSDELANYILDVAQTSIRITGLSQEDLDIIGNSYIEEYVKKHTFIS